MHRLLILLLLCTMSRATFAEVTIRFVASADMPANRIHVEGLSADAIRAFESQSAIQLSRHFKLYVNSEAENVAMPSVLGECSIENERLVFRPRFDLILGQVYRAEFHSPLPDQGTLQAIIQLPKANPTTQTRVVAVYPSSAELPQNLLKFYLHFSAPMEQGNVYRYIELSIENEEPLAFPFLELAEELWDRSGTRLTLLLDPGRIKRGLVPREEDGAILEIGKSYRLLIKSEWPDADGMPLNSATSKVFTVIQADFEQPNPGRWKIIPPEPSALAAEDGTYSTAATNRLQVVLPDPLDHALLKRCLVVVDSRGREIMGEVEIADKERCWIFTPRSPWQPGEYALQINPLLEDLAGNSIARPFEADLTQPALTPSSIESLRFVVP